MRSSAQPAQSPSLAAFTWLAGCWEGSVNQRDFREEWLPLRGEIMVGASQTAMQGKTVSYEFLRLEPRGDAIYYIPMPSGHKEAQFKLAGRKTDGDDEIFTFENVSGGVSATNHLSPWCRRLAICARCGPDQRLRTRK